MNSVAVLSAEDRRELFEQTAGRLGFGSVNVEKDFWVCWLLKQLFSIDALDGWLVFKGGTRTGLYDGRPTWKRGPSLPRVALLCRAMTSSSP